MTLDENDVLEYVEVKVHEPIENVFIVVKDKYKKGEIKAKKLIIDSFKDHLLTCIVKLEKSKDVYDKLVGMYEVNNSNHIPSLKNQLKDIKMNKGGIFQSNFMRIFQLRDQLQTIGEPTPNRELILVALQGIPPT